MYAALPGAGITAPPPALSRKALAPASPAPGGGCGSGGCEATRSGIADDGRWIVVWGTATAAASPLGGCPVGTRAAPPTSVAESLGGFGGATPAVKYPVQIWTPSLAARVTAGGADTALAAPAPD